MDLNSKGHSTISLLQLVKYGDLDRKTLHVMNSMLDNEVDREADNVQFFCEIACECKTESVLVSLFYDARGLISGGFFDNYDIDD